MADDSFSWALTGRFEGLDNRLDGFDRRIETNKRDADAEMTALRQDLGDVKEENAKIVQALTSLSDSWKALRTALYTFAVIVVGAAVTLIVIGKPI